MTTFRYDKDMLMAEFKIAKDKDIKLGISEIKSKYKNQIKFTDTLKCISYRK